MIFFYLFIFKSYIKRLFSSPKYVWATFQKINFQDHFKLISEVKCDSFVKRRNGDHLQCKIYILTHYISGQNCLNLMFSL